MDISTIADLFSYPGSDTRAWISYGIVDTDTEGDHSVQFDDENGDPLPHGVLINVTLQPNGISVRCRVLSHSAGSGEGEYSPFGPGDEVLVAIPEGDEASGCVIIGRLSNAYDVFPRSVAGMSVLNNDVTFRRIKTSYAMETGGAYSLRQATTGATLAINATGDVTLGSGDGHTLSLTASVISLQESTQQAGLQIDPSKLTASLLAGPTSFVVDPKKSVFLTPGTLSVGTAGSPAGGHAVTLEQVLNLIANTICVLGVQGAFAGPFATWTTPGVALPLLGTMMSTLILQASKPVPIATNGAPGGDLTLLAPPLGATVGAALSSQLPDPAGFGLPAPVQPGIGKPGLMF